MIHETERGKELHGVLIQLRTLRDELAPDINLGFKLNKGA